MNGKYLKLISFVVLVNSLIISGCSNNALESQIMQRTVQNYQNVQSPLNIEQKYSEKMKLSIMEGTGTTPLSPDVIKQELEDALNIEIELSSSLSGEDYTNQLNVRLAGGNYPDLFQIPNKQYIVQYSQNGILLDITPYMDNLMEVRQLIGDESLRKGMVDNKLFAIAKANQMPNFTYWIRKDWLDNLKMSPPSTLEDFFRVAKAFTEDDPDQNGKNDTYGITGIGIRKFFMSTNSFSIVFGAYGIGAPGEITSRDGKFIDALHDPAMKDALAFIKILISEGLVDPELMVNTGLDHQQKAIQGKAGMLNIDWANLKKDVFEAQIKALNPKAEWVQLAPIKGPGGQFDMSYDLGGSPMYLGLPKGLEKDTKKLQRIFDLLNYVSVGEGYNLVMYGIKGRHYNLEGNKIVKTDLLDKEGGYFWLYQFTGRKDREYLMLKFDKQAQYIDFAGRQPRLDNLYSFLIIPDSFNAAEADRFINEEITKFIYNKRSLDEYDDFLNTLDTQFNYRKFMEEAQSQLKVLGYVK